jgi:hypothetical protein
MPIQFGVWRLTDGQCTGLGPQTVGGPVIVGFPDLLPLDSHQQRPYAKYNEDLRIALSAGI